MWDDYIRILEKILTCFIFKLRELHRKLRLQQCVCVTEEFFNDPLARNWGGGSRIQIQTQTDIRQLLSL
jgi:hypothetical protein